MPRQVVIVVSEDDPDVNDVSAFILNELDAERIVTTMYTFISENKDDERDLEKVVADVLEAMENRPVKRA